MSRESNKQPDPVITRDDWLRALSEAGYHDTEHDEQAVTVREFGSMCGLPDYTAVRRLDAMVAKGLAVRTWKSGLMRDGRRTRLVAYRLSETRKKARK